MKKARISLIAIITLTMLTAGCIMDSYNHMLKVYNGSDKKISVLYTNTASPKADNDVNNIAFYVAEYNTISPGDTSVIVKPGNDNVWHEYINYGQEKKLFIYIFSVDTLRNYNTSEKITKVIEASNYLKKLSFTEQELSAANWTINYR